MHTRKLHSSTVTLTLPQSLCSQRSRQTVLDSWAGDCERSITEPCPCPWYRTSEGDSRMHSANVIADQVAIVDQVWRCQAVQCLEHQCGDLELNTVSDWQAV